ncbi:hypothetical protein VP1G_11098 [Cytospora mali]|uniref:Uncharacterized protein n=1 Tax=Cytospora mali TaxID=578113 RepID=A0A194V8I4_CYTMA|nr:hypothetical protein VP1G_11098 [Valsa mali var. pyri (nom. inval.)]
MARDSMKFFDDSAGGLTSSRYQQWKQVYILSSRRDRGKTWGPSGCGRPGASISTYRIRICIPIVNFGKLDKTPHSCESPAEVHLWELCSCRTFGTLDFLHTRVKARILYPENLERWKELAELDNSPDGNTSVRKLEATDLAISLLGIGQTSTGYVFPSFLGLQETNDLAQ